MALLSAKGVAVRGRADPVSIGFSRAATLSIRRISGTASSGCSLGCWFAENSEGIIRSLGADGLAALGTVSGAPARAAGRAGSKTATASSSLGNVSLKRRARLSVLSRLLPRFLSYGVGARPRSAVDARPGVYSAAPAFAGSS